MGNPSDIDTVDTLVFDLGDVIFDWSVPPATTIPQKTVRRMLNLVPWYQYEKGILSEDECYNALASELGIAVEDIRSFFHSARKTLAIRPAALDLIRQLKYGRSVYAMSNISAPDWEYMRETFPEVEAIFDVVFTSAHAGERKPNLGFYQHVLQQTGANPRRTVFIDDKLQNVFSARSLGMEGVVYDNFANVQRALHNICGNAVKRGEAFLRAHAPNHFSYTNSGHVVKDNFSQFLIFEATGDPSLVEYTVFDGPWHYFCGGPSDSTSNLPFDVDTTSVAYTTVSHAVPDSTKHRVMDEILNYRSSDNIIQVYFSASRPRIDAVVCVNALTLFHTYGRAEEVKETFNWIKDVLKRGAYLDGTYYYLSAEAFLYCLLRLIRVSPDARRELGSMHAQRCKERLGMPGDALAIAMRIICCEEYGFDASIDAAKLRAMQEIDGGWQDGWFYRNAVEGVVVANRGVTAAFAVKAIKMSSRKQWTDTHC